jgi:hypothetical protein
MADMRAYVLSLGLLPGRHGQATQPNIDSEPEAHP